MQRLSRNWCNISLFICMKIKSYQMGWHQTLKECSGFPRMMKYDMLFFLSVLCGFVINPESCFEVHVESIRIYEGHPVQQECLVMLKTDSVCAVELKIWQNTAIYQPCSVWSPSPDIYGIPGPLPRYTWPVALTLALHIYLCFLRLSGKTVVTPYDHFPCYVCAFHVCSFSCPASSLSVYSVLSTEVPEVSPLKEREMIYFIVLF